VWSIGAADPGLTFADGAAIIVLLVGLVLFAAIAALSHEHERAYSAAMVYLAVGVGAAAVTDLLDIPWLELGGDAKLLEHGAEVALALALFGTGLRIDRFPRRATRSALLLLAVGMVGTVAAVAAYGTELMGLSLGAAIVLGGILAPTDPVLAGSLGAKPPLEEAGHEEGAAPFALTTEAGLNDGLAAPFVLLGVFVVERDGESWLLEWFLTDALFASLVGIAVGAAAGYGVAAGAFRLHARRLVAPELDGFIGVAAALALFGLAEVAGGYGFLATFAGGIAFRRYEAQHEYNRHIHDTSEVVQNFAELGVLLLAGAMVDFGSLGAPGVAGWLMIPVLLLIVRPGLALLALARSGLTLRERLYLGWFGVKGIASVYYVAAVLAAGHLVGDGEAAVVWTAMAAVVVSILVHGVTASWLRAALLDDVQPAAAAGTRE
jgi:sodium/hydrogen antiporter